MFDVIRYSEDYKEDITNFLSKVIDKKTIKEDILINCSFVKNEEEIVGAISYEEFKDYGLIRYFVFKKEIDNDLIKELIDLLEETALSNGVNKLFSIIKNQDVKELFSLFDFEELDKNYVIIEEEVLNITKYEDTNIMLKEIS